MNAFAHKERSNIMCNKDCKLHIANLVTTLIMFAMASLLSCDMLTCTSCDLGIVHGVRHILQDFNLLVTSKVVLQMEIDLSG